MISDKFKRFLTESKESRMSFREAKRICENAGLKVLGENYLIDDDSVIAGTLSSEAYELNRICNDFRYLHLNSSGHIFDILHRRFEDYCYHIVNDIDYLCELVAQYRSGEKECCPVNFNSAPKSEPIGKDVLESEQTLIDAGISLLGDVLKSLEKCRKSAEDNDAAVSRFDDSASYWQKEYSYLLKRMTK